MERRLLGYDVASMALLGLPHFMTLVRLDGFQKKSAGLVSTRLLFRTRLQRDSSFLTILRLRCFNGALLLEPRSLCLCLGSTCFRLAKKLGGALQRYSSWGMI